MEPVIDQDMDRELRQLWRAMARLDRDDIERLAEGFDQQPAPYRPAPFKLAA